MGVGGGVILIPAMIYFLGMSQKTAQGTSLALMAFPVFLISAYNYWKAGYVDMKVVSVLLITFVIGSYFGSKLALQLPGKLLKQIFGAFLLLVALKMIFSK
jgi:uncharacterized membrane protein YfcA